MIFPVNAQLVLDCAMCPRHHVDLCAKRMPAPLLFDTSQHDAGFAGAQPRAKRKEERNIDVSGSQTCFDLLEIDEDVIA
jgi:hypothetical protein